MPGSKATKTVNRPPMVKADSSSSSLSGMEQYVPPFQKFVKQTPNVGEQRAIPPPPSVPRRASSTSPPRSRSRTPSSQGARRSSSVYSRTVSGWAPSEIRWQNTDYANEPLPPLPTLQPLAYSASTPQLVDKLPTPPLLLPRTYSPLIASPSPSRAGTPQPQPEVKQSTASNQSKSQKIQVRMVSLEKANAAVHSPGAIHLLPEELRAQSSGRSRSHEPVQMRIASYDVFAGKTPPEQPEPPTLVDNQGRQRSFHSSKDNISPTHAQFGPRYEESPRLPSDFEYLAPEVEDFAYKNQSKSERQPSNRPYDTDDSDASRGRTKERGPRKPNRTYGPAPKNDPYHLPTSQPPYHFNSSEESIGMQMKMVPQPLFQSKPPAQMPGSVNRHNSDKSVSPYHLSIHEASDNESRRRSSDNPFLLSHSVASDSSHMRTSTSGSIPISPPTSIDPASRQSPERVFKTVETPKKNESRRRKNKNPRVSAYYPHVASRKGIKHKKHRDISTTPPMPLLSADIIAQRSQTSEKSPEVKTVLKSEEKTLTGFRKYVDILTKPTEVPERRKHEAPTAVTASPGSPHLLPSPVRSKPPNVHLGWSTVAKETFDKAHSPPSTPTKPAPHPGGSLFTHIAAPARPLDESKAGLNEPETPRRKSSIFGSLFESWKESKADKRREELKKIIRVVPQTEMTAGGNFARRANVFGSV